MLCWLDAEEFGDQMNPALWDDYKAKLSDIFRSKTRQEWCDIMQGTDVCFAPVLSLWEAPEHPHNRERGTFTEVDGVTQPSPAPRFSRTAPEIHSGPRVSGQDTLAVLENFGFSLEEIQRLQASGTIPAS